MLQYRHLRGLLPGDGLLLADLELLHVGAHHPQLLLDVLDLLLGTLGKAVTPGGHDGDEDVRWTCR